MTTRVAPPRSRTARAAPQLPEWAPLSARYASSRATASVAVCDNPEPGADSSVRPLSLPGVRGARCMMPMRGERVTRTWAQRVADVSTAALTAHAFGTAELLDKYVGTFVLTVDRHLGPYLAAHGLRDDVHIVYKGGNVLAEYLRQLLRVDGVAASPQLARVLRSSDADFQVHFRTDAAFREHEDAVKRLVVAALMAFRGLLEDDGNGEVLQFSPNAPGLRDEYAALLREVGWRLDARAPVALAPRDDYFVLRLGGRRAAAVGVNEFMSPDECPAAYLPAPALVRGGPGHAAATPMYVSFNDTLDFDNVRGQRVVFDLARLKLNVHVPTDAGCVVRAPAELIDVSFTDPHDAGHRRTRDRPIGDWTRELRLAGGAATVRVPTLEHIVDHDLQNILFVAVRRPWDDAKYEKRMLRYLLGMVMLAAGDSSIEADALADAERWARAVNPLTEALTWLGRELAKLRFPPRTRTARTGTTRMTHTTRMTMYNTSRRTTMGAPPTTRREQPLFAEVIERAVRRFTTVLDRVRAVRDAVVADEQRLQQDGGDGGEAAAFNDMVAFMCDVVRMLTAHMQAIRTVRIGTLMLRVGTARAPDTTARDTTARNSYTRSTVVDIAARRTALQTEKPMPKR